MKFSDINYLQFSFLHPIAEAVDASESIFKQPLRTSLDIRLGVVVGDERHPHHNPLRTDRLQQMPQVAECPFVASSSIRLIDSIIQILNIDNVPINGRDDGLQIFGGHIEGGLHGKLPVGAAKLAEVADKVGTQQRLAAAETDSPARGKEVQPVNKHRLIKLFRREFLAKFFGSQATGIQTVAAMQRAAVESCQRGHAVAVNADAVAGNADERGSQRLLLTHPTHQSVRQSLQWYPLDGMF